MLAAQGAPTVSMTPVANGKKLQSEKFSLFLLDTLGYSRVSIQINFFLQVHFKLSTIWYCSHCFPPVLLTLMANLPPASSTVGANFAAGIVDNGSKFATGINNTSGTGGKICRRFCCNQWQICYRCQLYQRQFCKFATSVVDTGGAPWLEDISANFRKNSKGP